MKREGGSFPLLADHIQGRPVLFQNFQAYGKPQSGAFGLRGKEGVKNFFQVAFGDSDSRILYGNCDALGLGKSLDGKSSPLFHGLDGVEDEVDQDLLDLVLVDSHGRKGFPFFNLG